MRSKLLLLGLFMTIPLASKAQDQPNILWIITDDQRADALSCYNLATRGEVNSPLGYVESPNIDAIASEGVLFTRAYCNSPACAPSRTSMHTGQYPHHNALYDFTQTHTLPDFTRQVVPQILRNQGYGTAHFGKSGVYIFGWGPGQTYNRLPFYDLFIDHQGDLARKGFGDWSRYLSDETFWFPNGTSLTLSRARLIDMSEAEIQQREAFDPQYDILRSYTRWNDALILGGVSTKSASETTDAYILKEFLRYLDRPNSSYTSYGGSAIEGADTTKPLMIHLGFHLPHTPVLPPAEFRERFKDRVYNIPDFDKAELDKLPPQLLKIYDQMKIDDFSDEEKQQMIQDYYAFCAYGDSLIGEAVRKFKAYSEEHQQEYLIILAAGDHGWHLGEQGISAKFAPWDYSNHTGVIVVSSDKIKYPEGEINNTVVEFVDFAPTMYAEAGIDLEDPGFDYLDGYDLASVMDGSLAPREYVFGELNSVCGPRAYIRGEDFAFSMRVRESNGATSPTNPPNNNIRWALETTAEKAEMALYDLRVDPGERSNVAYDDGYTELAQWFRNKLGNISLGDGRVECSWSEENNYAISNFAPGADDKILDIPPGIIPSVDEYQEVNFSVYKKKAQSVRPLPQARIGISPLALFTDSLGQARSKLKSGSYQYIISAPGHQSLNRSIEIGQADTTLSDTLEVAFYQLQIQLIKDPDASPVAGIEVRMGDSIRVSDSLGLVRFDSLLYGNYSITITDPVFNPVIDMQVMLEKDSTVTIPLEPRSFNQLFRVKNLRSSDPINSASITLNGQTKLSDHNGEANFTLVPGTYEASISKTRFRDTTISISFGGDAVYEIRLRQILADATFRVLYQGFPLRDVKLSIAGDTLISSQSGIASISGLKADSVYDLHAWKPDYEPYSNQLLLQTDQIVTIHMQLATGIEPNIAGPPRVFPNPSSGEVHIHGLTNKEKIILYDLGGREIISKKAGERKMVLKLGHLPAGTYLLKIENGNEVFRIVLQ